MDAGRHPNIDVLTNAELIRLKGQAGRFQTTVRRHPRYVSEDLCSGCGQCGDNCPVVMPNEFEVGMGYRKSIYTPFEQAVPKYPVIERETCIYFEKGTCGKYQYIFLPVSQHYPKLSLYPFSCLLSN